MNILKSGKIGRQMLLVQMECFIVGFSLITKISGVWWQSYFNLWNMHFYLYYFQVSFIAFYVLFSLLFANLL